MKNIMPVMIKVFLKGTALATVLLGVALQRAEGVQVRQAPQLGVGVGEEARKENWNTHTTLKTTQTRLITNQQGSSELVPNWAEVYLTKYGDNKELWGTVANPNRRNVIEWAKAHPTAHPRVEKFLQFAEL